MLSSCSLINRGPGQKHVAQEVIDSREEPATLSCQVDMLSCPLSIYVYTRRLVPLSTLAREESFCGGQQWIERTHNLSSCWDCGSWVLSLKHDICITHTLLRGTLRKSGWKGCKTGKKCREVLSSHASAIALMHGFSCGYYTRASPQDWLTFQ